MTDIKDTLAARGNAYGDFREQGRITQNLKRAAQDSPNWHRIPAYMREGIDMILHKISRMLNGDALYDDNMHDIVGYTVLMQDRAKQDRNNGVVFETGGDPVYPAYKHEVREVAPVPIDGLRKMIKPIKVDVELSLQVLANYANIGAPFTREDAERVYSVIRSLRPWDFEDRLASVLSELEELGFRPRGMSIENQEIPENDKGETPWKVLRDHIPAEDKVVRQPEYLIDPVRAYYAAKDRNSVDVA